MIDEDGPAYSTTGGGKSQFALRLLLQTLQVEAARRGVQLDWTQEEMYDLLTDEEVEQRLRQVMQACGEEIVIIHDPRQSLDFAGRTEDQR